MNRKELYLSLDNMSALYICNSLEFRPQELFGVNLNGDSFSFQDVDYGLFEDWMAISSLGSSK